MRKHSMCANNSHLCLVELISISALEELLLVP